MAPEHGQPAFEGDEPPEVGPEHTRCEPNLDCVEDRLRDPEHGDRQQCAGNAARERGADDGRSRLPRKTEHERHVAQGASA